METPQLEKEAENGNVDHLQDLSDHEREIIEQQLRVPEVAVSYGTLYRYANGRDILLLSIGSICAIGAGVVMPLMAIVFGHFAGIFSKFLSGAITTSSFNHDLRQFSLYFVYLGVASLLTVFVTMVCFSYTGERMTQKIRESYLRAILRQNIGYFDNIGAGEVATRITADISLIQDGISQKVGLTITGLATFVAALVVGFVRSWKLTLVMLSITVAIILAMGGIGKVMRKFQTQSLNSSATGGTLAEDVISSIRTTTAFGSQDSLLAKYEGPQIEASNFDYKAKTALGLIIATMFCILNLQYGLAFWQGSRFLKDGDVTVSQILTVLFASMLAGVSLGHIAPYVGAFGMAIAAARKVFQTIDRPSSVDPETETGEKPVHVEGEISFQNIRHVYPSRPEQVILDDFTLHIPPGKMTAIVGASGSGKSTVIGLIERFYLPIRGELSLDGRNLHDLNLRWLRAKISLVSQEPVLFNTTIYKNIEYGLLGTEYDENEPSQYHETELRDSLVHEAAKIANAADFIQRLPQGFQTRVGESGSLLSGGQKQRIAIARAVVSNPKILLLDEATAALDTKSEGAVQVALEAASKGRTTVVIAHRLSTIKHADNIVVMAKGKIVEQGTHEQLLDLKKAYFGLVQSQQIRSDETTNDRLTSRVGDQEYLVGEEKGVAIQEAGVEAGSKEEGLEKTRKTGHDIPSTWTLIKFIWSMNENEKGAMILGCFCSVICGMGYPVTAIFAGNAIISFTYPSASNGGHDINFWCGMFLMLGLVMLLFYSLQGTAFAFASSRLIRRARVKAFRSILRQDIAFFDMEENASGTLASFLSIETNHLAGISGATLGAILNFLITIAGALAVSCAFGWKLALVCASTMPILLTCGFIRFWVLSRLEKQKKQETDAAGFACEATSAIRTVASLTLERYVRRHYHEMLDVQVTQDLQDVLLSSVLYAMSQSFTLLAMGLAFWYGGTLIVNHEYTVQQFFICFIAVIWGSQAAGGIFSYAPDMGNAKQAAFHLKALLERMPLIDSWSELGMNIPDLDGTVEFRNVSFAYPARPEQQVLNGVNFTAKPGQLVALVGSSGSGKSTTVALLERFYDPSSGGVFVDGQDISTYHLQDYRKHLALVSQETTIYMGTIKENILAGKSDASEEAIIRACQDANIYDFVMSLPDGLDTLVGAKGSLLSGGQKQRIAIAKALLRDPKILLLDEATSALDSDSEKAVQIALDRAAKGRTTIAIAHRLSTIQHADMIYVLDGGMVVENGTHGELMGRKGRYWELVKLQGLGAGSLEVVA